MYIFFPPFNLLGRVLTKIDLDQCEAIVIVPMWRQLQIDRVIRDSFCHLSSLTNQLAEVLFPAGLKRSSLIVA